MSKRKIQFISFLTFSFLIVSISSCKESSQSIDLTNDSTVSIFDVFSDISIVELETSPDFIIAEPSVIHYHNGFYYILDRRTQQLFCFDDQGGFNFKISNRGKGPGEYNYITNFSIDESKDMLLIIDPVLQFIHFYCSLTGDYKKTLRVDTGKVMGLDKVFAHNDSTLLVTSVADEQLLFVNMNTGEVLQKSFPYPTSQQHLEAFTPLELIYLYKGNIYIMPALSQKIQRVDGHSFELHYKWNFGKQNNSPEQLQKLIDEIKAGNKSTYPYEGVGSGKLLNHHFLFLFETERYHLAILEFDNDFVHVVYDKENDKPNVFKSFSEDISLFTTCFTADRTIGVERGIAWYFQENVPELANRNYNYFNLETLSPEYQELIKTRDPLTDNPFLVVYKFRE